LEHIVKTHTFVIAALAQGVGVGVALAQTPIMPPAEPSTMVKVENWTTKQSNTARTEWARGKTKWADCQQQSADQKLIGPESWSFLYTCMKT
jgi:hypothetical protein